MTSIVRAGEKDALLLAQIGGQTIFESHGTSAPHEVMQAYVNEKFSEEAVRAELADAANIFHIIYYQGAPAGYSKIIYNYPHPEIEEKEITKLERLYLLDQYHGLKLGQELFRFNVQLSQHQDQKGMWLFVWTGNEKAIRFYQKAGFRITGSLGWFRLTATHANPNHVMYLPYGNL